VDENGKKLDHNFEYRKSMEICRNIEQKYQLIPADKKEKQAETTIKGIQYGEENLKNQIAGVIRPLMKSYHFQTMGEYKALLSLYNITVEEIKGVTADKMFNGLVYSATDDKGERIGKAFKSSLFGKTVGYEALQQWMAQSGEIIKQKQLKDRCKSVMTKIIKSPGNQADFEKQLSANNINVVFRQNDTGRIYGVTFIDHQNKCVINGSRLGKEFSANVFNELFISSKENHYSQPQQQTNSNSGQSDKSNLRFKHDTENLDDSLNLFSMEANGSIDSEEEAFIRRMRKKKKRKKPI